MTDAVLFGHLIGALGFVAGLVLAGACFESARRCENAVEISALLGLARVGVFLVLGGGLLLLACGLWLVHLEDVGYDAAWVDAALALFAAALALGAAGGRRPKQARVLATRLAAEGNGVSPRLRALLDDPASRISNYAAAGLALAILALMVFKP